MASILNEDLELKWISNKQNLLFDNNGLPISQIIVPITTFDGIIFNSSWFISIEDGISMAVIDPSTSQVVLVIMLQDLTISNLVSNNVYLSLKCGQSNEYLLKFDSLAEVENAMTLITNFQNS